MEISEILDAFKINDGTYKRAYVDAAVELKTEITPHLIQILQNVLSDATPFEHPDRFDHIYAVMLLGHFEEPTAHETIVDVFSMPEERVEIFGDIITEDLPVILFRTCSGSLEKIQSLVLNQDAYDFCRSSALYAMVYAVVDGVVSRKEVLDFFGSLFTGQEASMDSHFWSGLASAACKLYPEELMPVIEKAYEDELIAPFYIGLGDFDKALKRGKEAVLEEVRHEMGRRMPKDIHQSMSLWASFNSKAQTPIASLAPMGTSQKKEKRKKHKKRKMARASRKRNRR